MVEPPLPASRPLSPDHPAGQSLANWVHDEFVPHPLVRGGHAQTLVPHLLPRRCPLPDAEERLIRVADEAQVLCHCHWQPARAASLTLILVHGLEGSSHAKYMRGTTHKAWAAGLNVVRMNVRNCGGTEALAPTLYHSGMSEDIAAVVRALIAGEHLERIALAGFSMGGNQVLKLAGEWGREHSTPPQVAAVAAISPAMDLAPSADAIHERQNRLYEWHFLRSLRERLRRTVQLFPGQFRVSRWQWESIRDFDDCITAPQAGFADAADYYTRASASQVIEFITLPTLILHAQDDPFVRVAPETYDKLAANPNIRFLETPSGGHCGFLAAKRLQHDHRWGEEQLVKFVRTQ